MTPTAQAVVQPKEFDDQAYEGGEIVVDPEQQMRAGAWSLLANVFRQSPDQVVLQHLFNLGVDSGDPGGDEIATTVQMLSLAVRNVRPEVIDSEFHALFVGLGRGELVPFGSWYQTGFLMEAPLSKLRDSLRVLGFERQEDVHEPEDHIAALAEVMTRLILEGRSHEEQAIFYQEHIEPWSARFFRDLSEAEHAVFYRAVSRFGMAFNKFERRYLGMRV